MMSRELSNFAKSLISEAKNKTKIPMVKGGYYRKTTYSGNNVFWTNIVKSWTDDEVTFYQYPYYKTTKQPRHIFEEWVRNALDSTDKRLGVEYKKNLLNGIIKKVNYKEFQAFEFEFIFLFSEYDKFKKAQKKVGYDEYRWPPNSWPWEKDEKWRYCKGSSTKSDFEELKKLMGKDLKLLKVNKLKGY